MNFFLKGVVSPQLPISKHEFDNIILIIFISLMSFLLIIGLIFINLSHREVLPPSGNSTPNSSRVISV